MRRRPKQIGTAAESAARDWLVDAGWPGCARQPLAGNRDQGDLLVNLDPKIIAEVKGGAQAESASHATVVGWLGEAEAEREHAGADLAVLIVRRYRRPVGLWDAYMSAGRFIAMASLGSPLSVILGSPARQPWERPVRLVLADWSEMAARWATTG